MPGETEIRIDAPAQLRASAVRFVIIPGLDNAGTVGQLADAPEMIFRVVVVGRANLHSLRVKAFSDGIASIPLFARLRIARAPDELLRAGDAAVLFLHYFGASKQNRLPP